jgi:hypothetical protein
MGALGGTLMREINPFAKEETLTIIETSPGEARIPETVRAVCIRPDPKDWKAKPRRDEIEDIIAGLPADTVELIDIDYACYLSRLPCLSRQNHIRYVHLGAHKLRDYSPLFMLKRIESLFLASVPFTSLSAFQDRPLKYIRLIRGRVTQVDVSAPRVFLQGCTRLTTFGDVSIPSLCLESCRRVDLTSVAIVRRLRQLQWFAPGLLASIEPLLG